MSTKFGSNLAAVGLDHCLIIIIYLGKRHKDTLSRLTDYQNSSDDEATGATCSNSHNEPDIIYEILYITI